MRERVRRVAGAGVFVVVLLILGWRYLQQTEVPFEQAELPTIGATSEKTGVAPEYLVKEITDGEPDETKQTEKPKRKTLQVMGAHKALCGSGSGVHAD